MPALLIAALPAERTGPLPGPKYFHSQTTAITTARRVNILFNARFIFSQKLMLSPVYKSAPASFKEKLNDS